MAVVGTGKDAQLEVCWQGMEDHARGLSRGKQAIHVLGREDRLFGESFSLAACGRQWGRKPMWSSGRTGPLGSCGNSVSSRAGLGEWHPPSPPAPLGSRAVFSDVGAHFREPELGRWFPRKKAGEKWVSPVSLGRGDRCTSDWCIGGHPLAGPGGNKPVPGNGVPATTTAVLCLLGRDTPGSR